MKEKKCRTCGKPRGYNLMYSRCKQCQYDFVASKPKKVKSIKQISDKKKTRLKETGGEVATFEKVNEVDKNCWVCGVYINEPATFTFPHILAKSKFPAYRLLKNNIARACSIEHHNELDKEILDIRKDIIYLSILQKLILDGTREEVKDYILSL